MAFVTWMLGHAFLAANLHLEREPLLRLGLLSNRLMVVWGAATIIFVAVVTTVPVAQAVFKTVALRGRDLVLSVGAALTNTFWIEVHKWLAASRRGVRATAGGTRKREGGLGRVDD